MSDEQDIELHDLIVQTLESNGVLGKIKAQLRSSVFIALEEERKDESPLAAGNNRPLQTFLSTPEGVAVASLFRDFLQCLGLEFTLSVFEPETNCGKQYVPRTRAQLAEDLGLSLQGTNGAPLLTQLLA